MAASIERTAPTNLAVAMTLEKPALSGNRPILTADIMVDKLLIGAWAAETLASHHASFS